jgi:hypothetical protein
MKRTAPKAESGGAGNATRIIPHSTGILVFPGYSVNHVLAQWRKEGNRLRAEFERTGNPAHLKAFNIHRAAMSARLANATEAKCR